MKERRSTILRHAEKKGCSAVAAFEPENLFYLTGFWGEAIAVCTEKGTKLIAPKLEYPRAKKASVNCQVIPTERGSELVSTFASEIKNGRACTDCSDYSTVESVRKHGGDIVVDTDPFFQTRRIKDEDEIRVISKAARILDKLYEICAEKIKAGLSERDLQAKLIYEAMKMDATPPSYKWTLNPLIIAGGPNGAQPHAQISDRKFKSGDMIVVDLTLRHEGYIADATRTFGLGAISSDKIKVYNVVRESQESGVKAVSEHMTCGDIDHICRQAIKQSGFDKFFVHATGHGIGLEVHEPPWIRGKNQRKLKSNMSVTIEPGIYLQDRFGVRIEDSVIVSGGVKNLCQFTKELVVKG